MVALVAGVPVCVGVITKHKAALQAKPKMRRLLPVISIGRFLRRASVTAPTRRIQRRLNFGELDGANVLAASSAVIGDFTSMFNAAGISGLGKLQFSKECRARARCSLTRARSWPLSTGNFLRRLRERYTSMVTSGYLTFFLLNAHGPALLFGVKWLDDRSDAAVQLR